MSVERFMDMYYKEFGRTLEEDGFQQSEKTDVIWKKMEFLKLRDKFKRIIERDDFSFLFFRFGEEYFPKYAIYMTLSDESADVCGEFNDVKKIYPLERDTAILFENIAYKNYPEKIEYQQFMDGYSVYFMTRDRGFYWESRCPEELISVKDMINRILEIFDRTDKRNIIT